MRLSSRRCCFGTPNAPREIHSRVICDGTGFEPPLQIKVISSINSKRVHKGVHKNFSYPSSFMSLSAIRNSGKRHPYETLSKNVGEFGELGEKFRNKLNLNEFFAFYA